MGYDLYVCDQEGQTLPTNYEDDLYFRRNIFGMGPLRDAMLQVGAGVAMQPDGTWRDNAITMAYWPMGGELPFPSSDDPDFPGSDNQNDAAVMAWLRDTRDERPGIPLHKLCSNDGWWVTAAECRSALDIWEQAGMPECDEFRDDWIPFLQAAAKHGGFRTF